MVSLVFDTLLQLYPSYKALCFTSFLFLKLILKMFKQEKDACANVVFNPEIRLVVEDTGGFKDSLSGDTAKVP